VGQLAGCKVTNSMIGEALGRVPEYLVGAKREP
jgi:hypothetical protein